MQAFVLFFCVNDEGEVLLAQRRDGNGDWWSVGSGTMDVPGEKAHETAMREVQEEFGAEANLCHHLGTREVRGRRLHDFFVHVYREHVQNAAPEEHVTIEWHDVRRPDTWPKPWHPNLEEFVRTYHAKILTMIAIRPAPRVR
jgi:8-oxo-dGTP pyrophosphatase MutT (NUDIX family)